MFSAFSSKCIFPTFRPHRSTFRSLWETWINVGYIWIYSHKRLLQG